MERQHLTFRYFDVDELNIPDSPVFIGRRNPPFNPELERVRARQYSEADFERDVNLVMEQVGDGVTRDDCKNALTKHDGDIVYAIQDMMLQSDEDESSEEEPDEEEPDNAEQDVDVVMQQAPGASRDDCKNALARNDSDLVNAIMDLTDRMERASRRDGVETNCEPRLVERFDVRFHWDLDIAGGGGGAAK